MKYVLALLGFLFCCAAQAQDALVVQACGAIPQQFSAGSARQLTVDVNGKLCGQVAAASGVYNGSSSALLHWRNAVSKVKAGTGRGKVLFIGDSTTMGAGAGTAGTTNLTGAYPKSPISSLSKILNNFVPVSFNSIFGDQGIATAGGGETYPQYDSRVTMGANWSLNTTCTAGTCFHYTSGVANNLTFAPTAAFDTIVLWTTVNPGLGSFTTNVDGGASLGTISENGSSALISTTYTVAKATHTINIVPNNDAGLFIVGIITYDSTTPAIDMVQLGYYGSQVSQWNVVSPSPWNPVSSLQSLAPDLCVINLTINDSNNVGLSGLPAYLTNMQAVITACKVSGDVMLMVGVPSNSANATNGTLSAYQSGLLGLAATNNTPLLSLFTRWTSYAYTNPVMPYFDNNHPTAVGYQDVAIAINEVLSSP